MFESKPLRRLPVILSAKPCAALSPAWTGDHREGDLRMTIDFVKALSELGMVHLDVMGRQHDFSAISLKLQPREKNATIHLQLEVFVHESSALGDDHQTARRRQDF